MVNLDGKWYNVDLKWDMERLKEKNFPLKEFLKSSEDFEHRDLFDYYFKNYEMMYCTESFPESEQLDLFFKSRQNNIIKK